MFVAFGQAGKDEKGRVRHRMARYYAVRSIVPRNRGRVNRLDSNNRAKPRCNADGDEPVAADTQTGLRSEPLCRIGTVITWTRSGLIQNELLRKQGSAHISIFERPFESRSWK